MPPLLDPSVTSSHSELALLGSVVEQLRLQGARYGDVPWFEGRSVQNLRFTDSILAAFARIEGVTAARSAVPTWWSSPSANVVPTLLIRGLQFTGTTTEKA